MSSWTKEPWIIESEPHNVWSKEGRLIARCGVNDYETQHDEDSANAARAAACVNALAGLNPEAVGMMKCVCEMASMLDDPTQPDFINMIRETLKAAKIALAKATTEE